MSRILACIDASTYATSVVDLAAWAAKGLGVDVELLHIVQRKDAIAARHDHSGAIGLGVKSELLEELTRIQLRQVRVDPAPVVVGGAAAGQDREAGPQRGGAAWQLHEQGVPVDHLGTRGLKPLERVAAGTHCASLPRNQHHGAGPLPRRQSLVDLAQGVELRGGPGERVLHRFQGVRHAQRGHGRPGPVWDDLQGGQLGGGHRPESLPRAMTQKTEQRRAVVSECSDPGTQGAAHARIAAGQDLARRLVSALDYVGVLCVEMFVTADGLLLNEIAPRPHNSGHYTIEACVTSQFAQQARILAEAPLGDTSLVQPAVMVNLLGDVWFDAATPMQPAWPEVLALPGAHLHLYGKAEARRARKMGHVTCTGATLDDALATAQRVKQILRIAA